MDPVSSEIIVDLSVTIVYNACRDCVPGNGRKEAKCKTGFRHLPASHSFLSRLWLAFSFTLERAGVDMARKQTIKMVEVTATIPTAASSGLFTDLYWQIQDLITAARARNDERADESYIRTATSTGDKGLATLLILILSEPLWKKINPLISKIRKVEMQVSDYHRAPFGQLCKVLTEDGYRCMNKFKTVNDDQFHMWQAPGKHTIILSLPTFKAFRLQPVDLGVAPARGNK
jgi:hypothetical protein